MHSSMSRRHACESLQLLRVILPFSLLCSLAAAFFLSFVLHLYDVQHINNCKWPQSNITRMMQQTTTLRSCRLGKRRSCRAALIGSIVWHMQHGSWAVAVWCCVRGVGTCFR